MVWGRALRSGLSGQKRDRPEGPYGVPPMRVGFVPTWDNLFPGVVKKGRSVLLLAAWATLLKTARTVHLAARTIAKMPALMASGSASQASTTAANSGSCGPFCAPSAPLFAPHSEGSMVFSDEFDVGSSPSSATYDRQ